MIQIFLDKTDIENGHFSGFQLFIADLKASRLIILFNLSGTMFHILGPSTETLPVPRYTKFIAGMASSGLCLRF